MNLSSYVEKRQKKNNKKDSSHQSLFEPDEKSLILPKRIA